MRPGVSSAICFLSVVVACQGTPAGSADPKVGIHPQPQPPSAREVKFTSPCTSSKCGEAPSTLESPRCKAEASGCAWSEDTSVSYRGCDASECGLAPGADVCPSGTTFKGNACGSEDNAACGWSTVCAPPASTTPCSTSDGCGAKPDIGVVCKDGGLGDLACMQFGARCDWQRTCE